MSDILNIILLVTLPIVAFFLYRHIRSGSRNSNIKVTFDKAQSQEAYAAKKYPKDEEVTLSLEEKINLSWQFLINITEQILNKFSKQDKNIVYEAGQKMNKHGMTYQHDVKQEAKLTINVIRARTRQQAQDKGRAR